MKPYDYYRAAQVAEPFSVWLRPRLTAWAQHHGFRREGPDRYGIDVRTQSEANTAALLHLGAESFATWLHESAAAEIQEGKDE